MENALAHGIIGWSFSVLDADYWPNVRYQLKNLNELPNAVVSGKGLARTRNEGCKPGNKVDGTEHNVGRP
jgi:hypothetical protein